MLTRRELLHGAGAALSLASAGRSAAAETQAPRARVREGWLEGVDQGGVRVFRGVPYAEPPVGALRFAPARPPRPWSGVRPARAFALPAMQLSGGVVPETAGAAPQVSEDCLYLNGWAPASGRDHPVFVFVHGGGNAGGSAANPALDGTAFARDGVVCVTVAYRVGAFGFLELGRAGAPYAGSGDNGLRDVIAALRWVQDNIAAFGGDPAKVTLGGQSAGAKNVCALVAAPAAKGLFRAAISESGGGQTVHQPPEADALAGRFLEALAAEGVGAGALRTCPGASILGAQARLMRAYERNFPFRPVAGGRLLPRRPVDLIAAGAAKDVAMLIGSNRHESFAFLDGRSAQSPLEAVELSNLDLAAAAPAFERYTARHPELSPLERRVRFLTEEEYEVPSLRVALAKAGQPGGAPVYGYRLDWRHGAGPARGWAAHTIDVQFVFDRPATAVTPEDLAMGQAIHRLWVAFIRDGRPADAAAPAWPALRPEGAQLMVLDHPFRSEPLDRTALGFWDGLL
jgi:para-nitrobenzyl esterase